MALTNNGKELSGTYGSNEQSDLGRVHEFKKTGKTMELSKLSDPSDWRKYATVPESVEFTTRPKDNSSSIFVCMDEDIVSGISYNFKNGEFKGTNTGNICGHYASGITLGKSLLETLLGYHLDLTKLKVKDTEPFKELFEF